MLLRTLLVLLLLSMPVAVAADSTASPDPAASSSGVSQSGSDASALGPAAGGVSSTATGGALQPAGGNPLQSTTGDSTGLTAPTSSALQAPATADPGQLQVVMGEADGPTYDPAAATSNWGWLGFSIFFGFMIIGASVLVRRRPLLFIQLRSNVAKLSLRP